MGGGIQRRVYRRHTLSLRVYLYIDRDWVQGATLDVSRRGMFVRIDSSLRVGENVRIRVEMTDGRMLNLVGIVRRVRLGDGGPTSEGGVGVELVGTSPDAQERWDAFVLGVGSESSETADEEPSSLYHGERTEVLEQQMLQDQIRSAREQLEGRADADQRAAGRRQTSAKVQGGRRGVPQLVVLPASSDEVRALARHVYEQVRVYLKTRAARDVGDPVSVVLVHPDTDAEFALDGKVSSVVRTEKGEQIGLRVSLDGLRPDRATQFEAFVETGEPLALGGDSRPAERAEMLRAACQRTPERARPFAELGLLLFVELGDVNAARVALMRAEKLDSSRADVLWALATIAALEQDRVASVGFARRARERGRELVDRPRRSRRA